jgi:pimeloyl-ACP methyl ester carboxylesterase
VQRARWQRGAGVTNLDQVIVPSAGHFTQEEAPAELWALLAEFIRR